MKRSESPQAFFNCRIAGWWLVLAIFSAGIAWSLCGVFALLRPMEFGFAYLTVLSFFITVAGGALFWVLLHHAVDAAWSVLLRRLWEHSACLLLPMLVLSIPLVLLGRHLWPWAAQPAASYGPWLPAGCIWFLLGASLLVLAGSAWWLRRISVHQDQGGGGAAALRRVAFASIPCDAVGFSFISIFVWMSLEWGWVSAIWPIYLFAGAALSGLASSVLIVVCLPAIADRMRPPHFRLLGRLLFAFTLFWAYIAFSQYLIIWYGNLPTETVFFREREHGLAQIAGWLLIFGHFLLPFLLLLPRAAKTHPKFLAIVAVWLLLMQFVDLCWIILPHMHGSSLFCGLAILLSFVAVGGTLAIFFLKWLGDTPLWPVADHRLEECLSLRDE